jgi:hypothetical protein
VCRRLSAFDLIDWVFADAADERRMRQRAEWLASEVGADPTSLWRWCAYTVAFVVISQLARGSKPAPATRSLLSLAESA